MQFFYNIQLIIFGTHFELYTVSKFVRFLRHTVVMELVKSLKSPSCQDVDSSGFTAHRAMGVAKVIKKVMMSHLKDSRSNIVKD